MTQIRSICLFATTLAFTALVSGAKELNITPSAKCVGTPYKKITLNSKASLNTCKRKCLNADECVAMQFASPDKCFLYNEKLKRVRESWLLNNIKKMLSYSHNMCFFR